MAELELSPRNRARPGCQRAPHTRKATSWIPFWRGVYGPGGVGDLWHHGNTVSGTREALPLAWQTCQVRTGEPRGTTVMDGCRESDRFRVPRKPSNRVAPGTGGEGGGEGSGQGERGGVNQEPDTRPGSPVTCSAAYGRPLCGA